MIENSVPLPPTVYPLAKGRTWAMLAGSLVFVALGIVFLVAHSTVKMTVAGVLAVSFFGFSSVIIARRLLRDRPELVLDDAGVDHVTLGRVRTGAGEWRPTFGPAEDRNGANVSAPTGAKRAFRDGLWS